MVQALVVFSYCLKNLIGADDIRVDKRPWVAQRVVIMALGGKMNDDISFADKFIHKFSIADITSDKIYFIQDRLEVIRISSVRQLINNSNIIFWAIFKG